MSYDGKPHKHVNEIIAWAMGTIVQVRVPPRGRFDNPWKDLEKDESPNWIPTLEYRVKPPPNPDVTIYAHIKKHSPFSCRVELTSEHNWNERGKPGYTLPVNVKLIYDGETEELKSVSML